jgi:hypothetical protein
MRLCVRARAFALVVIGLPTHASQLANDHDTSNFDEYPESVEDTKKVGLRPSDQALFEGF